MEFFLVAGAALFVFLLFFLVFMIRRRESGEPVRIHNCQNCGCGKKETAPLERFRQRAEKNCEQPSETGGFPDSENKADLS